MVAPDRENEVSLHDRPPEGAVLILGLGINGAAVARDLIINGVPVVIADRSDIASGATSRSSRLIHGGLRYLEYGEFSLVRESLRERDRLLKLAPQFVHPLPLFIPGNSQLGGLVSAVRRFVGFGDEAPRGRGRWLVDIGLTLYDVFSSGLLPGHAIYSPGDAGTPQVSRRFEWVARYYDAQMPFPERFTVALLHDAEQAARRGGVPLYVLPYHAVRRSGTRFTVVPTDAEPVGRSARQPGVAAAFDEAAAFRPGCVINATGAAGDRTLQELGLPHEPLFAGTKGSHIVTANTVLRDALRPGGVYAESRDGRMVFVLPFGKLVLIGTTDVPYQGDPSEAIAEESEIDYLLRLVNDVQDEVRLSRKDVLLHYAGVRPLPKTDAAHPGAVTRRHWFEESRLEGVPLLTLIGGKLTTCRSFAEQVTDRVLELLGRGRTESTENRPIPGSAQYPLPELLEDAQREVAEKLNWSLRQVRAVWPLTGTLCRRLGSD
ncbi:MAG: glycerol-3-phosphate dehydrogenase/oxidase, partial [Planctomycetota bacterium]